MPAIRQPSSTPLPVDGDVQRTEGLPWVRSLLDGAARSPEQASALVTLLARGEMMGLLGRHEGAWPLSDLASAVADLVGALDGAGAQSHRLTQLALAGEVADGASFLDALIEVTESNALPESEWGPLRDALGDDLLAELVDVSEASLRRYAAGSRRTPDDVGERLHWVALVVADLRGAYTDRGVRRWFRRPRTALGDTSPAALLREGFDPDSPRVAQVRALAHALVAPGAS